MFSSSLHGAPHHPSSTHSSIIGNSSYSSYQPSCNPQTHSNPTIPPYTPVRPYLPSPHHQPHLPYHLPYLMPQQPNPFLALQHGYFPLLASLYHNQHYNVPSYQTTTANTLTHSSQFSRDHSYDGPPLPQRPRLATSSLAMVDPLATATAYHSSSHVTHSLSTPFSPHVGQLSDTIPSSSGTTSSSPPSHLSPFSSSDITSSQHSPSHGLSPPKHPRLAHCTILSPHHSSSHQYSSVSHCRPSHKHPEIKSLPDNSCFTLQSAPDHHLLVTVCHRLSIFVD